jgi:hypothetical protein
MPRILVPGFTEMDFPEPMTPLMEAAQEELLNGKYSSLLMEAASVRDFPKLLRNTMHKKLMNTWDNFPSTWEVICSEIGSANDFREMTRQRLSGAEELLEVEEHGEYKDQDLLEEDLKFSIRKYGRLFGISWETLVNDDTNELKRMPERMGKAAKRGLDKDIWRYLFGASAGSGGPRISLDGKSLFCTEHRNVLTKNSGVNVIGEASLTNAFTAMRTQRDMRGEIIHLTPKYLIIGPELEIHAWKVLQGSPTMPMYPGAAGTPSGGFFSPEFGASSTGGGGGDGLTPGSAAVVPRFPSNVKNFFAGKLQVVVVPWMNSPTEWYLLADPNQHDTMEVSFLKGRREPELFTQDGTQGKAFERDEIRYKMRMCWGKAILDYRSFYQGSQ